ncbi:hypothetical protein [Schlesneria sp.]|uniref:hypothetical protein n=1 Tax=Schlesneria sp. TaxID=2762018 RepID=UPI002F1FF8F5
MVARFKPPLVLSRRRLMVPGGGPTPGDLPSSTRPGRIECKALIDEITVKTIGYLFPGDRAKISIDWGSNVEGLETGCLKAGEVVASCTAEVYRQPDGATDLGFGVAAVNDGPVRIGKRICQAGECTICFVGTTVEQVRGEYRVKFRVTTSEGNVYTRVVRINVSEK